MKIKRGNFLVGDCLELMKDIPDASVDMILCDLPYGTTACKWDTVIPFDRLWKSYQRVCKKDAAIVLCAAQPFTTALISSNITKFRYCWVWRKPKPQGFMNAKKRPLKDTEDIVVFSYGRESYTPQGTTPTTRTVKNTGTKNSRGAKENEDKTSANNSIKDAEYTQTVTDYPRTIIDFSNARNDQIHPTQKPVALFEYLTRTYTNRGDLVLDNCAGSGTTAIACENTGRQWICMEQDKAYAHVAIERIKANPITLTRP